MLTKGIIAMVSALSLAGTAGWISRTPEPKATVYLVLSTDCPIAMQYTPRINRLVNEFSDDGVTFKAIFPNDLESRQAVAKYMSERDYKFDWSLDLGAVEAKKLGVKNVPTAVVVDPKGKVLFRGGIDDNADITLVKNNFLRDALTSTIEGKTPAVKESKTFGCLLMPGETPPTKAKVNYSEHVAEILNNHCVECHRPGEVAPFSLMGYENAKKWAPMIANVTSSRKMPPWKAVHGFGEFQDENRLSEAQIEILKRWNDAGGTAGDLKAAPKNPEFKSEWSLGQPDRILTNKEFILDAEGADEYRNFVVYTNESKDPMWVTAMDVRPGNTKIVHHVIAFIDGGKQALRKEADAKDGKPGYATFGGPGFIPVGSLGGWAPGLRARHASDEAAFKVPAGASVVMQVHYHRNGKVEKDQTKLGIYLAKTQPKKEIRLAWLANPLFKIPAGAKNHMVKLEYRAPADITVYGAMPHMHLLGRSMKAEIRYADGAVKPLVFIDDWNFNWQMAYVLRQPIKVPAGTKIYVEGYYDNSTENPFQPLKTPRDITWGEETTDEMFLLVVPYTLDAENLG